jgi:hypothetical protein
VDFWPNVYLSWCVVFLFVFLWFYRSAFCHPIGAKLGSMKLKVVWEFPLSTGFFNMERKKIAPLVTLSRANAFVLGSVIIAGRE